MTAHASECDCKQDRNDGKHCRGATVNCIARQAFANGLPDAFEHEVSADDKKRHDGGQGNVHAPLCRDFVNQRNN